MNREKLIAKLTGVEKPEGCWVWPGHTVLSGDKMRYGRIGVGGKKVLVHRLAYLLFIGEIGKGKVCHRCDNPLCCNPAHLFLGTQKENIHDAMRKGRFHPWETPPINRAMGESSGQSKLTNDEVLKIRVLREQGEKTTALAKAYSVSAGVISRICTRKIWKHI